MKFKLTIILQFFLCNLLIGQNRSLTIIFDTLNLHPQHKFNVSTVSQKSDSMFRHYEQTDTVPNNFPMTQSLEQLNFEIELTINVDSADLLIPFDNDGGYIRLSNLKDLKTNTVRFNSWTVYSNCFKDTIFETIECYKRNPVDTIPLGDPYKIKRIYKVIKKDCFRSVPLSGTIRINNRSYTISPQKVKSLTGDIIRYEKGYSRDIYKMKNKNPDKKLTYKHTLRETKKYINYMVIPLKD
jgi:hypothetical protein